MSTKVFGVEIELRDHASPVVADSAIGLYNVSSALASDAAASQKNAVVSDGTKFKVGDRVLLSDTDSISVLSANAALSALTIDVADGTKFMVDDTIVIEDDESFELNAVASIATNTLTLKGRLRNDYTTANNAQAKFYEDHIISVISTDTLTMASNISKTYEAAKSGTAYASSKFRWIQNSVTSLTGWATGIITAGGIKTFTRRADDLIRGGALAAGGTAGITVKNTDQFFNTISGKKIYINGLKATVVLFTDTARSDEWSGVCEKPTWNTKEYMINFSQPNAIRRANIVTQISRTDFPYADPDLEGKALPVTYGEFRPLYDENGNISFSSYAKFVRIANSVDRWKNDRYYNTITPDKQVMFPVIAPSGSTPTLWFDISLGLSLGGGSASYPSWVGWYLKSSEGQSNGAYRAIVSATISSLVAKIQVADYFTDVPEGDATAKDDNQTWIQIEDINRSYAVESEPCFAYTDKDGTALTTGLELYSYTSDESVSVSGAQEIVRIVATIESFRRLPQFAYKDSGNALKNQIDIDVSLFENDVDTLNSFILLPVENFTEYTESTLENLNASGSDTYENYERIVTDGYYFKNSVQRKGTISIAKGDPALVIDKDPDTMYTVDIVQETTAQLIGVSVYDQIYAVKFDLPEIPDNFEFDSVYIAIDMNSQVYDSTPDNYTDLILRYRRFLGYAEDIVVTAEGAMYDDVLTSGDRSYSAFGVVNSMPDFYYPDVSEGSKGFYVNSDISSDTNEFTGYTRFQLSGVSTVDQYRAVHECILAMYEKYTANVSTYYGKWRMDIKQIAVMFKKKASIKDAIFLPFKGRIFNDTWEGRKTAASMVESPIDIYEDVCRRQNWGDVSASPAAGWGKGIAPNARINIARSLLSGNAASGQADVAIVDASRFHANQLVTVKDDTSSEAIRILSISGNTLTMGANLTNAYTTAANAVCWADGCFDADDLTAWAVTLRPARQLLELEDGWTDELKASLTRDFMLVGWVNKWGEECVKRIIKEETSPTDTITLADITDRMRIRIDEPNPDDIYPEPFVMYARNPETREYQKSIRFTNVDATSYDSSYVEGWLVGLGASAEEYWKRCGVLWNYIHEVGKPSSDFTDIEWGDGYYGRDVGWNSITEKIDWAYNPVISFPAHYNKVGKWEEGHEFIVQLPHQTNDVNIECRLVQIAIEPNEPYECSVSAIMLSATIPADFNIQDSTTYTGGDRDWIDTTTTYGNDQDKIDID